MSVLYRLCFDVHHRVYICLSVFLHLISFPKKERRNKKNKIIKIKRNKERKKDFKESF